MWINGCVSNEHLVDVFINKEQNESQIKCGHAFVNRFMWLIHQVELRWFQVSSKNHKLELA